MCNSSNGYSVQNLADAWLHQPIVTKFVDRAIEIRAFMSRGGRQYEQEILEGGNMDGAPQFVTCNPSVFPGIPRKETVKVKLKLIVANELGHKTSVTIASSMTAASTALGSMIAGPGGGAAAFVLTSAGTAWAADTAKVHDELLKKGRPIETGWVELGERVHGVRFVGNGQELFKLRQEPRSDWPEAEAIAWRPINAGFRTAFGFPASVQASVQQTRRAERRSVAQNDWSRAPGFSAGVQASVQQTRRARAAGFSAGVQAPVQQTRQAERRSVAQNDWSRAPGFAAGALASATPAIR
jgi:hypothetical protein